MKSANGGGAFPEDQDREGIDLIIRTDTADLADMEILKANTGSQVFLEVHLTFCDAMEDLSLKIFM